MMKDGSKDWAYALKKRHESGEKLSLIQVSSYRAALGLDKESGVETIEKSDEPSTDEWMREAV
jgi:hypothetical protein